MPQLKDRTEFHTPSPAGTSKTMETTDQVRITTPEKVGGMGHRMKRKEDPRFLQGQGRYVDRPCFAPYWDAQKLRNAQAVPTRVERKLPARAT